MKINAMYPVSMVILGLFCCVIGAPTDIETQQEDPAKLSALKTKLDKLHTLLQELYDDPVGQPPSEDTTPETTAAPVTSADVDQKTGDSDSGELHHLHKEQPREMAEPDINKKQPLVPKEDESVKKLASVLAQLPSPKYVANDDAGEQVELNDKEFEEVVSKALENLLLQHRTRGVEGRNQEMRRRYEEFHQRNLHEQALRAVEVRLLKDIQTAKGMGVSVVEVIEDLEAKDDEDAVIKEGQRRWGGFRKFG